jgi:glutamate N-acetyltransferase/amino-acid N-acetyltransferase
MILPRMATMLATTDPRWAGFLPARAGRRPTFNSLTIDGQTSTSDTVLAPERRCGQPADRPDCARRSRARAVEIAASSATGSRATARVNGSRRSRSRARADADADRVARSVANSALVKTALFGADPNWGRIVQTIGAWRAPAAVGSTRIGGVQMLRGGEPRAAPAAPRRAMKKREVAIEISLGAAPRAHAHHRLLRVRRVNAEYTT